MKALVTGGRGFIGSFLVEELLHHGLEVTCLLRNHCRRHTWLQGLDFQAVAGDINEPESLSEAVKGVDYVFHLAGLTKFISRSAYYHVNVDGTKNLLSAVQKHNLSLKKFVLVSSQSAAGPAASKQPLKEADPPQPVSHYGRSKLQAEEAARTFMPRLPTAIVRPPSVFGPRDTDIFNFFKLTQKNVHLQISGGDRYLSLIYVKDLVRGIWLVAEKAQSSGQMYYLCNDDFISWQTFAETLAEVMAVRARKVVIPLSLAFLVFGGYQVYNGILRQPSLFSTDKFKELRPRFWLCSNAKAKSELGFQTQFGLKEAVQETYRWYLDNGWL